MHELSERCGRHCKSTGKPCRKWVVGGGPCPSHGGKARQVNAKREARVAAWEAAQRSGAEVVERDPAEMLLAMARDADALTQRLGSQLDADAQLSGAAVASLGEWIDRTSKTAKLVLDSRLDERKVRISERMADQIERVLRASMAAVFVLLRERLDEQARPVLDQLERTEVPQVLRAELLAAVPAEDDGKGQA